MLPGPTVKLGGRDLLVSPARVRVTRYLKGRGPSTVTVMTAVARSGHTVDEELIDAEPGQRWRIYSFSRHMPFDTSICNGSQLAGEAAGGA